MGVGAMWLPLETIGYMIGSINLLGELAYASFFYVWWRRCWRDSACVAILEEAIQPDGTPGLLLHTVAGVHPVKLVECDPRSRRLRMSAPATAFGLKVAPANSAIWWQAVESIDNLVRAHGSPTADDDR
jgi:hypothetical protein